MPETLKLGWVEQLKYRLLIDASTTHVSVARDVLSDLCDAAEAHLKQTAAPARPEGLLELPACAAILTARNVIIAGRRHGDCLLSARDLFIAKQDISIQGFMTNYGRFVDRQEALKLRKAAGLPSADPGGYRGDQLYSEDLY